MHPENDDDLYVSDNDNVFAKVGVPNHQISFIWTGRALGDCLAAVVTSVVFRLLGSPRP